MAKEGKISDEFIDIATDTFIQSLDVIYDNIKIVEVDNLGADTMAPSISASDKKTTQYAQCKTNMFPYIF